MAVMGDGNFFDRNGVRGGGVGGSFCNGKM